MIVVFDDFQSPYDSVWREKLMDMLQAGRVKGRMLEWIHKYITECFCATELKNKLSLSKQITKGLSQGAVIIPPFLM